MLNKFFIISQSHFLRRLIQPHNYRTIFVNAIASEFLILLQQINLLKIVHQPHKIHYKTIRFPAMKSISMIRAW